MGLQQENVYENHVKRVTVVLAIRLQGERLGVVSMDVQDRESSSVQQGFLLRTALNMLSLQR